MTHTVVKIIIIIALLASAACSSHTVDVPDRPSSEPDINPELSDGSTRISGPILTLHYDDGGIIFSRSADGVISAVRLSDGVGFEYDTSAKTFRINGADVALQDCRLLQKKDGVEWHQLKLSDRKTDIFIVTDI